MNELTLLSIAVTLFVIILVIAGVFTFLKSIVHRLDGDIYNSWYRCFIHYDGEE